MRVSLRTRDPRRPGLARSRREAELVTSFDDERTRSQRTAVDMMAMVMEQGARALEAPRVNDNSVRTMPVHSELVRLGFVTWVTS